MAHAHSEGTFEDSPFVSVGRAYAGFGSRATPSHLAPKLTGIAQRLTDLGYTLRSGCVAGADTYFERGAGPHADLFVPSATARSRTSAGARLIFPSGGILDRCLLIASNVHPNFAACDEYARLLLARDMCLIWGELLNSPVAFVVIWSPPERDGSVVGGTAIAWEVAKADLIPRYNLAVANDEARFFEMLDLVESERN